MIRRPSAAAALAALLAAAPLHAQAREYIVVGSGGGAAQGAITTYLLDRGSGELKQIDRVVAGRTASYVALNPRHPVLYLTDERGSAVHWVGIDPATGMLEARGQQAASGNPVYLRVDATGSVLIGVNHARGTIDVFPLDPVTGAVAGAPATLATGANPHSAVFDAANALLFVASVADNHIARFTLRDGALHPLDPLGIPVEGGVRHIVLHPNGEYLYGVAGGSDNVVALRVGPGGALSEIQRLGRLTPEQSAEAATHMGSDIHITPDGRFLYAANRGASNSIVIFSVGTDGRLTLVGHEATRGSTPRTFTLDQAGDLLIVANQDSGSVASFRRDPASGRLEHLRTEEVDVTPWFVGSWRP